MRPHESRCALPGSSPGAILTSIRVSLCAFGCCFHSCSILFGSVNTLDYLISCLAGSEGKCRPDRGLSSGAPPYLPQSILFREKWQVLPSRKHSSDKVLRLRMAG